MDQADTSRLRAEARATIKAAAADLDEVADRWPVLPEHLRAQARILDRLSQELAEAASMLRRSTPQAARLISGIRWAVPRMAPLRRPGRCC